MSSNKNPIQNDIASKEGAGAEAAQSDPNVYRVIIGDTVFKVLARYQNLQLIGSGSQGMVCSAYDSETNERVAIKKLSRPFQNESTAKRAYRELKLMKSLVNHPNIIRLLNVFTPQNTLETFQDLYLVMELMESTLDYVIRNNEQIHLKHDQISFMVYQLLCGIKFLHSGGIIHRDIKPSNLVINSNLDFKILDFGISRAISQNQSANRRMTEHVVTRYYRAPEVIAGMLYDQKVDVWSAGCIMGEMIRSSPLFPGTDGVDQWDKICKLLGSPNNSCSLLARLDPEIRECLEKRQQFNGSSFETIFPDVLFLEGGSQHPNITAANARDVLSKMLVIDPVQRISVDEILEHDYFKDWYLEEIVNSPAPPSYDNTVEEEQLEVQQWKELIYQEI